MVNKHMKIYSTSVTREIQIKTTIRYKFTPIRMAEIETTDFGEDMEKSEPSYIACRPMKWWNHFGKHFHVIWLLSLRMTEVYSWCWVNQ